MFGAALRSSQQLIFMNMLTRPHIFPIENASEKSKLTTTTTTKYTTPKSNAIISCYMLTRPFASACCLFFLIFTIRCLVFFSPLRCFCLFYSVSSKTCVKCNAISLCLYSSVHICSIFVGIVNASLCAYARKSIAP